MKKFLAVAAVLAVSSVHASDVKFGDLNYFLEQGKFNVIVDGTLSTENTTVDDTTQFEADGYVVNSKFSYALTNHLNFSLGLDYLFAVDTEMTKENAFETNGLQNPSLGADFRILNQATSGINLDVGAIAHFKLMDREVGSNDPKKEGNMLDPNLSRIAEPRNTLEVNARLGKKWNEANEFYLVGGVIYHADGDYEDKSQDATVDVDSSTDFKFGGYYQYRPVNEFMMNFGLVATRYSDVDAEANDVKFTRDAHTDYTFNFTAKYLITDTTIAKFLYTQDMRDDYKVGDAKYDDRKAHAFGFGVDLLF